MFHFLWYLSSLGVNPSHSKDASRGFVSMASGIHCTTTVGPIYVGQWCPRKPIDVGQWGIGTGTRTAFLGEIQPVFFQDLGSFV